MHRTLVVRKALLFALGCAACAPPAVSNPRRDGGGDSGGQGGSGGRPGADVAAAAGGAAGATPLGSGGGTVVGAGAGGRADAGGGTGVDAANPADAIPDNRDAPSLDAGLDAGGGEAAPIVRRLVDPYYTVTTEQDGMYDFVMPWADRSAAPVDLSGLNASATMLPITVGTDGHLYRDGVRYRLFGANITFGSCTPSKEKADIIAARLAKLGFNAVRLQGCDSYFGWPANPPLIDYGAATTDTLNAERLDRFDYLFAALRKRGIYVDIGLQTARRFLPGDSGDPQNPLPVPPITAGESWTVVDMDQHQTLGFFYDPVNPAQQRYARNLLGHVNPYTGLSLAKDPALVSVELVNEAGLVHYWMWDRLQTMPAPALALLQQKWNTWLAARYATTAAVDSAWGGTPQPTEMLANRDFAPPLAPWELFVQSPAVATATLEASGDGGKPALRIDITTTGTESWHVELHQAGLTLKPGQAYRISFRARASASRSFQYAITKNADPYDFYSPWQATTLGTDWQDYAVAFTAPAEAADPAGARFLFGGLGLATGSVWIAQPSIVTGGPVLQTGETLEAGTIPNLPRTADRLFPRPALLDWLRFLRDTEAAFYEKMTTYLKQDLGVGALMVGSQIITSPPTVQAALDVIDQHGYWDHPQFPGKMWDPENWFIDNHSAVFSPPGVLGLLAGARVAGKPLLATETSHLAPNLYAGEGPLLTAAYASLQDLDGFFQFTWGYDNRQEGTGIVDYTDLDHHPPKLASIPAAARLFRGFEVTAAKKALTVAMSPDVELSTLADKGHAWLPADPSLRGFPVAAATIDRVEMNVSTSATDSAWPDLSSTTKLVSDTGELSWDQSAGVVVINAARARAVIGFADDQSYALGGPGVDCTVASGPCVVIKPGQSLLGHSTIALELVEGDSFATGNARAILSATGTVRNADMQWNASQTSLGRNWGHGPTRVEVIDATVELPRSAAEVAVYALDGRGQRLAQVPVTGTGTASLHIGGGVPTLWYEVVLGTMAAPGEGNHGLDACAGYCAVALAEPPACYAGANDCLADCAAWRSELLGSRCDCAAEVDAVFACDKANGGRVCGRLSQGVPPSEACLGAYEQAFRCAGKVAPCTGVLTEIPIDDFEDGDTRASHPGFGSWYVNADSATTYTPTPFAISAHGALGSGRAAHLAASLAYADSSFVMLALGAAQATGIDLTGYVGIGFSARGVGRLRASLGTTDMDAVSDWDRPGKVYDLTPTWRRYTLRFDDPDFRQAGWGAKMAFARDKVSTLQFSQGQNGTFDVWLDDVVLLRAE
jgi:hypothetical protein